jgi:hypothetical protein
MSEAGRWQTRRGFEGFIYGNTPALENTFKLFINFIKWVIINFHPCACGPWDAKLNTINNFHYLYLGGRLWSGRYIYSVLRDGNRRQKVYQLIQSIHGESCQI